MLLSQISNECWLLPVVEGQVGQGREVPDKDLKESAGAGRGALLTQNWVGRGLGSDGAGA